MKGKRKTSARDPTRPSTKGSFFTMRYVLFALRSAVWIKVVLKTKSLSLFCQKIQPVDSEYKEGREYMLSEFIKEGSYGEVHSAQDVNTGFKFAVKKVKQNLPSHHMFSQAPVCPHRLSSLQIAMKRFNSEEVGAWSTLRSPHVAELFGVVREGPYVLLFMDLKAGN